MNLGPNQSLSNLLIIEKAIRLSEFRKSGSKCQDIIILGFHLQMLKDKCQNLMKHLSHGKSAQTDNYDLRKKRCNQ